MVDEHRCRGAIAGERALRAERDRAHVVVVADAHHHDVGVGRGCGGRGRAAPPCCATQCSAFAGVRL